NPIDLDGIRDLGDLDGSPFTGPGPALVAAGRLSQEKGFDRLLQAMPKVVAAFPDATLTILGSGPLDEALHTQAHRLTLSRSVTFAGFQMNPWRYFRHADLFVLPSRREGFSNALLEALALGIPAVAFDCPGAIREIYGANPNVRLVRDDDP